MYVDIEFYRELERAKVIAGDGVQVQESAKAREGESKSERKGERKGKRERERERERERQGGRGTGWLVTPNSSSSPPLKMLSASLNSSPILPINNKGRG